MTLQELHMVSGESSEGVRARLHWESARDEVVGAYRGWSSAQHAEKGAAYAAYVAAIDREAAAADAYGRSAAA